MTGERVKVLYIAGSGRSGSTILDRILGQLDGFFSAGELCNLWDRGLLAHRKCGCGVPVDQCPTWTGILAAGFGRQLDQADATRVIALRRGWVRVRHIPKVLATHWRRPGDGDELLAVLGRLYGAVQEHTGRRVIVDSSKAPLYAELLARSPLVDLHVVHLVRDPRAAAYSWLRTKQLPDFGDVRQMQRLPPLKSSGLWTLWQTRSELLVGRPRDRYLRLRYEDFVRDPQAAVRQVAALVGEQPPALPFQSANAVCLQATHSVSGNPKPVRDRNRPPAAGQRVGARPPPDPPGARDRRYLAAAAVVSPSPPGAAHCASAGRRPRRQNRWLTPPCRAAGRTDAPQPAVTGWPPP